MQVGRGEGAPRGNVGEADQGVHEGELAGMVELEPRDALAVGEEGRGGERAELAAIDERLQDVLLDVEVLVDDAGHPFAEAREVLDGLGDPVVGHMVGGGLRPEQEMVADVLLDEAVAVVTADDGVGQVEVFDDGLELAPIPSGHLAAEDGRNFVRLADRSVGIEQALSQAIQAARRWKRRLSQYSTWAKNNRCGQPACWRSRAVKKGVK